MLSSGVESLLDSSVCAVTEKLYTGLPESISTELMAVSEPRGGLHVKPDVSTPVLVCSDSLSAEHHRTSGAENFWQKTEDLGDRLEVISHGPAESLTKVLLKAGDPEEDEKKQRNFRKLDCSSDTCQKEDEGAQGAEEYHAECCALTSGESWSKQEDPHLNQHEVKSLRMCCTEIAGSLESTEENQANVQVTAETLPKLTEEVQGMKADGTRRFSKAGYRNDRVSKGLPPKSNESPDVDTVMARAEVSETSTLDCVEPLKITDIESATEHPQETGEYNGLKAHTAMPLRTGGDVVAVWETREEKLPQRSPINKFSTPLANCQTYQQDEENHAHDFCTDPVPNHNEPYRLSPVESCRPLSTKHSEVLYSVLKNISYLDFRNMPLENNSTAVHGILSETPKIYLTQNIQSQTHYDRGTGFVANRTSTSIPAEHTSVLKSQGLSSAEIDPKEVSASIDKSYNSEFEEAAEVKRKIAGDNIEIHSWPEDHEGANSEHCHSSVSGSVASSPEEFSKEEFIKVPSEGDKLKKDQWQFSVSDLCKDDVKENSLLVEMSNAASHEIGLTHICFYNTFSKISPSSSQSCLNLSTKLEKDSSEVQLLEKQSNRTSEELAGSLVKATEANDHLSSDKESNLLYTLNVTLPPVERGEPGCIECSPCTSNEVLSRDKAQDNPSRKESVGASGNTEEQVTEIMLHKDKFKSSVSSKIFHTPNMTSKIFQNDMKSSAGNTEDVVTDLENERSDTWNCNNQSVQAQCTAASTSCILSGSTHVDDVLLNSHSISVEVDKKSEENYYLEGEGSAGFNSTKAIIFPEAHFPLACGSVPCGDDWGNRGVDLHGINDISTEKNMFCSVYTAVKSAATLVRDVSNKSMDIVKQCDLCNVTDSSEIIRDRDEAKDQISMCVLQTNEFDIIRTVDSPKATEGNRRNKTTEQLFVRYLNKKTCVHNFRFCHSPLGVKKRELGTWEKKAVSSLTANPSECSTSICDTGLLLSSVRSQTQHASQTGKSLCRMENQCLACQSEFDGPVPGSEQHLESLNKQLNTGLGATATSVEETTPPICSSRSEGEPLKTGDDLPLLVHKDAREDSFQRTLKENVVDLDCLTGVGLDSDLCEEKTIKLKEHENGYEREDKGTLEESFCTSKSHCSQHACSTECAKERAELVSAENKMQQSLPKMKWLVEDQENTVSAQFLPFSSIHDSLSYKPGSMNVLSETENKKTLRIKPILNNTCLQLTFESVKVTDVQKGIGPSHFGKFNIQESFNETLSDSEILSSLNLGISLPEKEKLCGSSENTQIDNCDSSAAKAFSKDSSVTKPLSVAMPTKQKASNTEIPSSETEMVTSFLYGAKSSRICARSKKSLRNERHSMLTVKDMDVSSQKSTRCREKFKSTGLEEKMGREVAPRKKLPIDPFLDGEDCLGASLEGSKESGSKIVPLSTKNYGNILEEIPRSNTCNLSRERKNYTKLTNIAGTSLLSEPVHDCQAEDASDAETSPDLRYNTIPTFYPPVSILSNSSKEPSSNCVVCSEVCVPYKLNARSKDSVREITEGLDTVPTHSVCKENESLGSQRLDQIEKRQVFKQQKYKKMKVHLSGKAQQEQKSEYQEKAKITLQPNMLHSFELLHSSSPKFVTSRNMKFEGPSEEIFALGTSENKLSSTLQGVKRPKITTDISSQFLKTQDSKMENLNLNLGYDGIPGAFGTTNNQRGPLPLKRQPGRTCKKVPTSYQLKTVRKSKKVNSSPFFEKPLEVLPEQENALLKSLYSPYKPPPMEMESAMRFVHMPRQRAKRCSLNSLKFRKCTKEPALLSKLSAMASKLLAPAKSVRNLEPLPYSSEILSVGERYSQRRSKNLLEAFSCINKNLHSCWADSWCTKMFSFQPLALYPVESTKILFSDLNHKPPTSSLDTPVFPISFHIKLDSSPVTDLTKITAQNSVHHRPVLEEKAALPSKWTFSFLLSQSCSDATAFKEDSRLNDELHSSLSVTTQTAAALNLDRGRNAVAERRGGYSMLGLHTVLALSSPGCYRIWTRRRNLTSRIPTIQRLFISQFTQGLKGARYPASVADDLVSSLPYSLGRALSIWSQHGPSACPSEITPLHSSHCKWQPSVGIENSSSAMLPHFPVQSLEALQTAGYLRGLETSFPLPLPKSCSLPELLPSPAKLSASERQVHALDEADISIPACLRSQGDTELKKPEPEKRPNKVSQIRIRKTVPKLDHNLTPMGLPKPKRLKKKEFSLEEIYTNKNYKSPPPARSLETIFEEPKEKNGRLISVSQQKRKRILEFQDFTLPRKRKARGKIKAVGSFTRAKKAALQSAELDALLSQKLVDLEAFFAKEAEQEQASSI